MPRKNLTAEEKAQKKAEADAKKALGSANVEVKTYAGMIVGDPEALRPKELPLVIKPEGDAWANPAQEEFAKILNAYAYRNVEKWAGKKHALLTQLADLAEHPELLAKYMGTSSDAKKIKYKDQRIQGGDEESN